MDTGDPRPRASLRAIAGIAILVASVLLTGCTNQRQAASQRERARIAISGGGGGGSSANPNDAEMPIGSTDPCAANLQDLAGSFLLYYAARHQLPPTLDALNQVAPVDSVELTCPVSHQPYIYNAGGVMAPNGNGLAILYDAEPSHNGMRYALTIVPPQPNAALVAKVIAIPEPTFAAAAAMAGQPLAEPPRPPQRPPQQR